MSDWIKSFFPCLKPWSQRFSRVGSCRGRIPALVLLLVLHAILIQAAPLPHHLSALPPLTFSVEEKAWLEQNRHLRVGVTPDFPPYEFLDASGTLKGLVGDYMALISHQLGVELVKVSDLPSWQHVMEAFQKGRLDLLASVQITEERKQFVQFTTPVVELQNVVFVLDGSPPIHSFKDLSGRRLASLKGWASTLWVASNCPDIELVQCNRVEDLFGQILLKGADAGLLDIGTLGYHVSDHQLTNLSIAFTTHLSFPLAIGIRKDLQVLSGLIDRSFQSIPARVRQNIHQRWVTHPGARSFRHVASILIALAVVLLGFVFWNIQLRSMVSRRTAELELEAEGNRRQTLALQESERKFRAIFNQTFEFMGMVAPDGTLLAANRSSLEFIGYEESHVVGRLFWETPWWNFDPALQDRIRDAHQRAAGGEFVRFDTHHLGRHGTTRLFDFSISPVRDELGKILFLVAEGRDITSLKAAQEAAQESEQRFHDLFELSPDPCLLIDNGKFIECNRAALRILGYEQKSDLFQMHPGDLSPPLQPDGRNSRDKAEEMIHLATQRGVNRFEWVHRRRDGSELFLEVTLAAIPMHGRTLFYCQWRDLSERRRTQAALRESRALVSAALETMPFDFWMCDPDCRLTLQNPGSIQHWGMQLGHRLEDFLSSATAAMLRTDLQKALKGDFLQIERAFPLGERTGWFRMILAPIRDNQAILGALGILIDITDRKQAEDEKQVLEQQIRQTQKIESIGRLAGGIAHDFNNYLTAILGHAELGKSEAPATHPSRAAFDEIIQTATLASSLTRQLLTFSRKQPSQTRVIDLNHLLTEVRRLIERLLGEQIRFDFQTDPEPACIRADPGQIEQVLVNLAVNARDAMPDGGALTIKVSHVQQSPTGAPRPLEIPPGDFVSVSVQDTGTGMTEEVKQRLFEPFFTTKAAGKGTGLGLATVFSIIRQSGGWVTVDSQLGRGTTFHVYLPQLNVAPDAVSEAKAGGSLPGTTNQPPRETIMLVEDEDSLRKLIFRFLQKSGYVLTAFPSGEQALEALALPDAKAPDLLISDVILPGINGRVLAEKLRKRFPDLPVLFTSGYSDEVIETHGVFKDGMEFLPKPYTPHDLAQHVRRILDQQSPRKR